MATKTEIDLELFKQVLLNSASFLEAAKTLSIRATKVSSLAKELGIYPGNKRKRRGTRDYTPEYIRNRYLSNKYPISSYSLKVLLINHGMKEAKCECCGLSEWLGQPIPLDLHHKNGNHYDNNEDNIILVCPTCHRYLERKNRIITVLDRLKERSLPKKEKDRPTVVSASLVKGRKFNCSAEELICLVKQYGTFTGVALHFGVSDNAIRKRCKRLGLLEEIEPIIKANKRTRAISNRTHDKT